MPPDTPPTRPANFVWYELGTSDADASKTFYSNVLGWGTQDAGMPDRSYTLLTVHGIPIGGLFQKPASSFADGAKPGWIGYIGVEDLGAASSRLQAAGGIVHRPAEAILGIGSFAVVADPQGVIFVLFQPPTDIQIQVPAPGTPGTAAWHDLIAIDWGTAFSFYAGLFGWTRSDTVDMGPQGTYQIFASGNKPIGGMMNRLDPAQSPGWLFYFHVAEIQAAIERVKANGGQVTHGPSVVPGGRQIAHCLDPQGDTFALVSPR